MYAHKLYTRHNLNPTQLKSMALEILNMTRSFLQLRSTTCLGSIITKYRIMITECYFI